MTKLLQESPVFITCPDCGKVQHKKLKWMRGHTSMKCAKCKSRLQLAGQAFKTQLSETVKAFKAFEKTLMELDKGAIKAGAKNKQKKKAAKKNAKKHSAKKQSHTAKASMSAGKAPAATSLASVSAIQNDP